ncbi:MAG: hypothetical protein J0H94_02360 [Rhizobiales bacterium]|nr:hypothetical protein [Hyphomicrobiales bacterium]
MGTGIIGNGGSRFIRSGAFPIKALRRNKAKPSPQLWAETTDRVDLLKVGKLLESKVRQ